MIILYGVEGGGSGLGYSNTKDIFIIIFFPFHFYYISKIQTNQLTLVYVHIVRKQYISYINRKLVIKRSELKNKIKEEEKNKRNSTIEIYTSRFSLQPNVVGKIGRQNFKQALGL